MNLAICVLLGGILLGRLLRGALSLGLLRKLSMGAILLLLFLLGASIGMSGEIMGKLGPLGADALLLALFCLAGSIAASVLLSRLPGSAALPRKKGAEPRR